MRCPFHHIERDPLRSAWLWLPKSCKNISTCKKFTESAQSLGPENTGPERLLPDLLAPRPVNSPTRITLENNGKIRPQPDRENSLAEASGGVVMALPGLREAVQVEILGFQAAQEPG